MKVEVKLLRTVQVSPQEMVWNLFGDESRPVQRIECQQALIQKFGPPAKGIHFFWNFNHTKKLMYDMTVGIEVMGFDIQDADKLQQGLIEADFLNRDEVLRREGALLSELERIGIFLIGQEDPFSWRVFYTTKGN